MQKIPFGIKKVASMCVLKCEHQFLLLKRAKEPNRGMYVPLDDLFILKIEDYLG